MAHTVGYLIAEISGTGTGAVQSLNALRVAAGVTDEEWQNLSWVHIQVGGACTYGFNPAGTLPFSLQANEYRTFSMTEAIQNMAINTAGTYAIALFGQ